MGVEAPGYLRYQLKEQAINASAWCGAFQDSKGPDPVDFIS
jgi:hypothetical protein